MEPTYLTTYIKAANTALDTLILIDRWIPESYRKNVMNGVKAAISNLEAAHYEELKKEAK